MTLTLQMGTTLDSIILFRQQFNRFNRCLSTVTTHSYDELYWFTEVVDQSSPFQAPDWAVCQFEDLEILIQRVDTHYRVQQIRGVKNPESRFDAEGYLKPHYQEILPFTVSQSQDFLLRLLEVA